jgi:antitoxin PrlF
MAENLMLKLFLDTLIRFALEDPNLLTPYTQQMADEMDELLAGVTLDEDS